MPKIQQKCTHRDCNNKTWGKESKCSLHCKKNIYSTDYQSGLLSDFFDNFINYLLEDLYELHNNNLTSQISKQKLEEYLHSRTYDNKTLNNILSEILVVPTSIFFPTRDSRDTFDYRRILNLFGQIHFNYCEFYLSFLELKNTECFFQDCVFHEYWSLQDYKILANVDNVLYQACTFKKVSNFINDNELERIVLTNNQFDFTCKFISIELERVHLKSMLFSSAGYNVSSDKICIKNIYFDECLFDDRLILNHLFIGDIKIVNCAINAKFEFKYNHAKSILIENSNFEKLVDFHGTCGMKDIEDVGTNIKINTTIFNDFALFEKSFFNTAEFKYVTFLGTINFRESQFQSKFDIDTINFKEAPNFYQIQLKNPMSSSRETLRIIKYAFEKNANQIDAGKYFSLEMQRRKIELDNVKWKGCFQEKFVFFVNHHASSFGQSYFKPIFWIIIFAVLYGVIIDGQEQDLLYKMYPSLNSQLSLVSNFFNDMIKNIIPFKNLLRDGMEFISLIFYIIFVILIWQTVVSLKMYTKRN